MRINNTIRDSSNDGDQNTGLLETEINAFMADLPEMLKSRRGLTTIYKGETRYGFWPTYKAGLVAAVRKFGLTSYLVREVSTEYLEYGRFGKPLQMPDYVFP